MSTHKYLYNFSRLHHKIPVEKEQLDTHTIISSVVAKEEPSNQEILTYIIIVPYYS